METDDRRRSGCVPRRALLKLRLLLDTATFIWALQSPERLSARALRALQDDDASRELSAISITEIAIKSGKGKLDVRREDVVAGLADLRVQVLPWNARHALQLFALPPHHADPFTGRFWRRRWPRKSRWWRPMRNSGVTGASTSSGEFCAAGIAAGSSGG